VTVLRDIPSVGIFFAVYELMKYSLSDGGAHSLAFVEVMLAGLVAGVPAAALVTPIDVVKTR
jgi:solute carrier family 25 aspartate/glutamate transporter 12/13